jgi:hypothetical protein
MQIAHRVDRPIEGFESLRPRSLALGAVSRPGHTQRTLPVRRHAYLKADLAHTQSSTLSLAPMRHSAIRSRFRLQDGPHWLSCDLCGISGRVMPLFDCRSQPTALTRPGAPRRGSAPLPLWNSQARWFGRVGNRSAPEGLHTRPTCVQARRR